MMKKYHLFLCRSIELHGRRDGRKLFISDG